MNPLEGIALILGLCAGLCLSGYWLASLLETSTTAERLAVSMLAGLASLLLLVSAVNFFVPLVWPWVGLCLLPLLATLAWGRSRRSLVRDGRGFWHDAESRLVGAFLLLFFGLLLWPLLRDSAMVFYDGSPNHDSFFWISNAEYLKKHSYMVPVLKSPTQPLFNATQAIIGWHPDWGRMGAEGLLALTSALAGTSAIKLYLYSTVALYLPWVAAVYLVAKTFFTSKLSPLSLAALATLQPLFIFYYANANLPNLIGMLVGVAAVLATEQALRSSSSATSSFWSWWCLLVLSLHGLYCAYPEMIPFIGLSCLLLWSRGFLQRRDASGRRQTQLVAAAALLSLALNPATTIRALHGFFAVMGIAQANQHYINIFAGLAPGEYLPALSTLNIPLARSLDNWLGVPVSLAIIIGGGLALWHARDRFGVFAILAGGLLLFIYTLATGFAYGWQKTVQFSGIFVVVIAPVMALDSLWTLAVKPAVARWLARGGALLLGTFMLHSTIKSGTDVHAWSTLKTISTDWFDLRSHSRAHLQQAPVLVEAGTFRMAFFHGMWAAYFMPDSHIFFGTRGEQSGGYLRSDVISETDHAIPPAAAVLVGRPWADSFDANSPQIVAGREFALLERSNRMWDMQGVTPVNGPPDFASDQFSFELTPAVVSQLDFTLTPRAPDPVPTTTSWTVTRRVSGQPDQVTIVQGPPPWHMTVPLLPRQRQHISVSADTPAETLAEYRHIISDLRIRSAPGPMNPAGQILDFTRPETWHDFLPRGLTPVSNGTGVETAPDSAEMHFVALPAKTDIDLVLIAEPIEHSAPAQGPLQTELWFNGGAIFAGAFQGPGVLRARIFSEHWNLQPVGLLQLRFPGNPAGGPRLLIRSLSLQPAVTPRP